MRVKVQSKVEHEIMELKAKVHDLEVIRKRLTCLGASKVGTFRQIDVYFNVVEGRLKLREVEGNSNAELIYYERENVAGPKRSNVFILKIQDPRVFKNLLRRLLKTSAIVGKVREVFRYQGTQIHLDTVEKLGNFVEFERKTPAGELATKKNQRILEELMEKLGISPESLEKLSYSDLIQRKNY